METQQHNVKAVPLAEEHLDWFVDVASFHMIFDELRRPELFNRPVLLELAKKGLEAGTAFVAIKGNTPVGAIGCLPCNNIYNPDIKYFAELVWYVLPEYRGTRASALLLKAIDEKAQEMRVDEITLSILPSSNVNFSSLSKRGFMLEEYGLRKKYLYGSS